MCLGLFFGLNSAVRFYTPPSGGLFLGSKPAVEIYTDGCEMKSNLALLENRHDIPPEELSNFIADNFGGNLLTLRQLEPYIVEINRRFRHLPRKASVDGKYKAISGHRNFKDWCSGVLHRTDRAVRYMLQKARGDERKPKNETETISAQLERCKAYIAKTKLDEPTKNSILEILSARTTQENLWQNTASS